VNYKHRARGASILAPFVLPPLDFRPIRRQWAMSPELLLPHLTALGVGLLIGTERERRKGTGPQREAAGLRTYTLAALLGLLSWQLGGVWLLMLALLILGALTALGYEHSRKQDPGLTSEIALLITALLGATAAEHSALAAGLGVCVAVLLAARTRLHKFVRATLTEAELHDGLLLAGAALVILPLVPDRALGPLHAFNPHAVWLIVVVLLSISALGHVASRALGPRAGLPLAGLVAGFVSSAAAISALASRAKAQPDLHAPAVAGATLSTVATFIQMALLLGVVNPGLLLHMLPALCAGAAMALLYGLIFTRRASRSIATGLESARRPLSPLTALAFAALVTVVSVGVALLHHYLGHDGALVGAAVAGLVDAHAPSAALAGLAAHTGLDTTTAKLGILLALTTNSATKLLLARALGSTQFAREVVLGQILVMTALWLPSLAGLYGKLG
jgi:uncharacterized membrane protein (DUF4010 family)